MFVSLLQEQILTLYLNIVSLQLVSSISIINILIQNSLKKNDNLKFMGTEAVSLFAGFRHRQSGGGANVSCH